MNAPHTQLLHEILTDNINDVAEQLGATIRSHASVWEPLMHGYRISGTKTFRKMPEKIRAKKLLGEEGRKKKKKVLPSV